MEGDELEGADVPDALSLGHAADPAGEVIAEHRE